MKRHDDIKAYESVRPLIYRTVWDFVRMQRKKGFFNFDREELEAEAHLAFVIALRSWKPEMSKFSTWVRKKVWWRLLGTRRSHDEPLPADLACPTFVVFDLDALDLNEDARTCAANVLWPPPDVTPAGDGLRGLTETLVDAGWSGVRIADAMRKVRERK